MMKILKIGGDIVGLIESTEELMRQIENMDRNNSVYQFSIRGKGKFTLVLQEEEEQSIQRDTVKSPPLKQMIQESLSEYRDGKGISTVELLQSLSVEDFE